MSKSYGFIEITGVVAAMDALSFAFSSFFAADFTSNEIPDDW